MPLSNPRPTMFVLLALVLALAGVLPAKAQTTPVRPRNDFRSGMRTGFGYAGVMPDAILGLGAFHFIGGKPVGVFADVKATALSGISKNDTYCPIGIAVCTSAWVLAERNDQYIEQTSEWFVVNGGAMYSLTPDFAIMLGFGFARETRFQEYFDDNADGAQRVTNSGSYFVDDDIEPAWKAQAVGGFLLRAGQRIAFRVGYETAVSGLGFGAYFRLR